MGEMMKFGVMITPALVVDGEVKLTGKAPSSSDLKPLLGGS
ncbi:MAG: thioredoxin family protein [Desulfovibrionales bacterium]